MTRICNEIIEITQKGKDPDRVLGEQEIELISRYLFEGDISEEVISEIKTEMNDQPIKLGDYFVAVLNNELAIRNIIALKFFNEVEKKKLGYMLENYINGEITLGEAMENIGLFV